VCSTNPFIDNKAGNAKFLFVAPNQSIAIKDLREQNVKVCDSFGSVVLNALMNP